MYFEEALDLKQSQQVGLISDVRSAFEAGWQLGLWGMISYVFLPPRQYMTTLYVALVDDFGRFEGWKVLLKPCDHIWSISTRGRLPPLFSICHKIGQLQKNPIRNSFLPLWHV